jgi:hypothetical protein
MGATTRGPVRASGGQFQAVFRGFERQSENALGGLNLLLADRFPLESEKRTTGFEPATLSLGS